MSNKYPSFEEESRSAMDGVWFFVGLTSEISNDGDYFLRKIYSNEMIVRNANGLICAFNNRCAHRGANLFTDKYGNSNLKCPFHGWIYNNEGGISSIPFNNYYNIKNKQCLKLNSYKTELIGCFIFVNYSPSPQPLSAQFDISIINFLIDISMHLDSYKSSTTFEAACNWKLLYEITIDPLHVPFVHHSTLNKLRPFKPKKNVQPLITEQLTNIKELSGLSETNREPVNLYPWRNHVKRWKNQDVYIDVVIFPNLHLVTPDGGFSFSYESFFPVNYHSTLIQYVFTTAKRKSNYAYFPVIHLESMRQGLEVYLEDIVIAENLQKTSSNYIKDNNPGIYEENIYRFRNFFREK
jgi:phenylpropionate dioxygenase-like ring-hydroxylating dioxygenase large terminal subunit